MMEYFDLKGKHVFVRVWTEYVPSPDPFTLVFIIDNTILVGICWDGKLEGAAVNVHGFFQELLMASSYMLRPDDPKVQDFSQSERELAKWDKFQLNNEPVVFRTTLNTEAAELYYFCATEDLARIYYYNDLLEVTNCPEFKGKHKGVVELPLREFVEDVLKVSREYLEEYAPLIAEIQREHGDTPENYDFLWELYREVEELYERGFNLETSVNGREK
ncbi:hypothetical protein [Thermococcus thioreducens]|uniref:Uncharacterized protein n=2 Tax=Thermococcus thioreducens TaxID=277988 RepID=A0A1I0MID3_9EURY|nr:hypothetical protein [Thermococcus thioreducens]SEV87576.1 hypothetical protein SAMN05216170_0567 [Thermococcus thioreducens]